MSREVLQQALDYVERHAIIDGIPVRDAIKAALAQPEQNQFKPDWNTASVLVEEMQRMAKQLEEMQDWEAVAADQAMTIALLRSEQTTVTCQIYGHVVGACVECNTHIEHEPMLTKNEKGLTLHVNWDDLPAGTRLYTSQPQRQALMDAEIWQLVKDCSFNRDFQADKFPRATEKAHGIGEKT